MFHHYFKEKDKLMKIEEELPEILYPALSNTNEQNYVNFIHTVNITAP